MKKCLFTIWMTVYLFIEVNGQINLLKDINSVPDNISGQPGSFTDVNGTLFFAAQTNSGRELWKIDPATEQPLLVKDILNGTGSSNPSNLTHVNGTLYFTAGDGINGVELWKSDGK